MTTNFKNRVKYSFDIYPVAILGTGFKNVTVDSQLNYQTAMGFIDVDALHQNVYAYLPAGTPDRPQDFDYLLITTEDGNQTVIGIPWIVDESVVVVQNLKASVLIEDIGSTSDIERLRACLSQNGFNKNTITLIGG